MCQILTAAQCRCYANERDVLTLPLMRHAGVVEFIGCREDWLPGGVGTQLMIVMSYERLGCLVEYLKNNTVDWTTACRMMHSLAAGLAHLHTELTDGGVCFSFFSAVSIECCPVLLLSCDSIFVLSEFSMSCQPKSRNCFSSPSQKLVIFGQLVVYYVRLWYAEFEHTFWRISDFL